MQSTVWKKKRGFARQCVVLAAAVVLAPALLAQQNQGKGPVVSVQSQQQTLARNLDRIEAGTNDPARDINGLVGGFQNLVPHLSSFTESDYAMNRNLVRRSMAWLAAMEQQGVRDPQLGRSISGAYGFFGDFQARPELRPYGYGAGASMGYLGAGRVSRRLWLGGYRDFDRDIERFALSLANWNALYYGIGGGMRRQRAPEGLDAADYELPPSNRQLVAYPELDPSVAGAKRDEWREFMPQFAAVSSRVLEAHRNLDALAARLERRGMVVNARDLAISYQMQGFLEDAADLVRQGDFEKAKLALERASYTCNQLKPVTGQ